jgi:DNA-binding MarR family transcriptional regulator
MLALEREPNLHAGEIARLMRVSRQAVHRLLMQLERAGLVRLLPFDHGVRVAALSDLGQRRLATCRPAVREALRPIRRLSPEERNELHASLMTLERTLSVSRWAPLEE